MLKESLKKYFGFNEFRPGQEQIINDILNKKNVLAIMPTGAGKSLCYQLPSLLSETYSIIISPLISLMQDQVNSINQKIYSAAFINSSLDYRSTEKVLQEILSNKIKMLFIAPEKLNNPHFVERIKNTNPTYLFVDEAHCISEWGHNFRPSYRNIKQFSNSIGLKNISAFTATATPDVRNDIIEQLDFNNPSIHVFGFERPNLSLNVEITKSKKERILKVLKENDNPTIIYTSTRKSSEQLTEFLKINKLNAEFYHAGLSNELRRIIQDDFIKNNINVIVATNAFGMGIDKQDIGMVIHYNIPGSIENLYQEFGRAGRDGSQSKVYLFYSERDKKTQDFLIKINFPTFDQIKLTYDAIFDYHKIAVNSKSNSILTIEDNLIKLIESKSIYKGLLSSIFTNLELSGYIKIQPSSAIDYFIKFILNQNQLKQYLKDISNNELKDFTLNLIKLYGSQLFSKKTKIDLEYLISSIGENRKNILNNFQTLVRVGIIEYDQPFFSPRIEMISERIPSKNLRLHVNEINEKLLHSQNKLNSVVDYVFTKDCRFKYILNYFGETVEGYKCGICDNCMNNSVIFNSSEEYLSEIIIRTFKEFKGLLSGKRLIGILSGKSKSYVAKSISTYQSCTNYKTEQIDKAIMLLKSKGILKDFKGQLFFNPVEELIIDDNDIVENGKNSKKIFNYENNLELYNKLREERNLAAKKFAQHPEMICSDQILKKISQEQPNSPTLLLGIPDISQRMYNKIGLEFLSVIIEHKTTCKNLTQHKELPKHISQTYNLIVKGYSLSDITNLLKLPESIVSIQVETIISYYPNENYDSLIPVEEFDQIKNSIKYQSDGLKEIKKKLPNSISFAKIRIVKAILFSVKISSN